MGGVMTFPARQGYAPRRVANQMDGLTHDLRNVVASLELCAEVMGQPGVLTPDHEYLAGEVRTVADAAMGLLRGLGCLAEGQPAQLAGWTERERVAGGRVAQVLADMEALLRRSVGSRVRVDVECAPCWGRMAMPAEDLTRVLVNLVRNASEAMPMGGRIRVAAQMAGGQSFAVGGSPFQDAHAVVISVQDNGPGVPGELVEKIFEPGFTTKGAGDGNAAGSGDHGLGLAVARELVELAGGVLVLAPSTRGARFEMEIPLTNVMRSRGMRTRFDGVGGRA